MTNDHLGDETVSPYELQPLPLEPDRDPSGRHPVSVGHLVMGVAFLGLAVIWVLFESDTIASDDLRWLMPLPWLAAGVAGLLAVVLTGRGRGVTRD
ncbi:hypothetical protein [Nocardioides sp. P5_C9_2]